MGKFGWSYPAGCDSTPADEFPPWEVCGNDPDDCTYPECPRCGETGNPACYKVHAWPLLSPPPLTLEQVP